MDHRKSFASPFAAWACVAVLLLSAVARADGPKVTGQVDGAGPPDDNFEVHTVFECEGMPICTGTYRANARDAFCSNSYFVSGDLEITGLDLSRPGPLAGSVTFHQVESHHIRNGDGTCTMSFGASVAVIESYNASWNGTNGTIAVHETNGGGKPYDITGTFKSDVSVPAVFPMVVTTNIDAVQASAGAQIEFRPQDVGTQGSVYVFAVAPSPVVKDTAAAKRATDDPMVAYRWKASGGDKDEVPVQCVLAQLGESGQLQAVSSDALRAYVTGVLGANGQAVTILNGVPTVNIAGATFYVGYGTSAATMLNNGINRSAFTVPGARVCQPKPPQTGWWWNPNEGGRGYSLEVRGNNLFFASFLYDESGRSTWYVSPGPVSLDGSLFTGTLYSAAGGQTLGGPYTGGPRTASEGSVMLAFDSVTTGTMVWPGGTVRIERMNMVPGGLAMPMAAHQPESGWWWNESESGRGFFLEWQGNTLDIAGYMYDDAGNPVWYITYLTTNAMNGAVGHGVDGAWWSYAGGQTLHGAWKPNHQVSNNVAALHIDFTAPDTALMTLPNGRSTTLRRQRF